jgi:hypothetical protein
VQREHIFPQCPDSPSGFNTETFPRVLQSSFIQKIYLSSWYQFNFTRVSARCYWIKGHKFRSNKVIRMLKYCVGGIQMRAEMVGMCNSEGCENLEESWREGRWLLHNHAHRSLMSRSGKQAVSCTPGL